MMGKLDEALKHAIRGVKLANPDERIDEETEIANITVEESEQSNENSKQSNHKNSNRDAGMGARKR